MITIKKDGRILVGASDSKFDWPLQIVADDGEVVACIDRKGQPHISKPFSVAFVLAEQMEADINPRVVVET